MSCCINCRKPVPERTDRGGTLRFAWLRAPPLPRMQKIVPRPRLGRLTQMPSYEGGEYFRVTRSAACAMGILLAASALPLGLSAQSAPPASNASPGFPAAEKQVPKPESPVLRSTPIQTSPPVTVEQVFYLARSTLLTLNDANRSGNYSVLRDLAAPDFQAKNSAADLAASFTDLRRRNFDLFAAALIPPQLTTAPTIDANGRLHLSGLFPTRPLQIKFELIFDNSAGQWKLFGIAVTTPEAPPVEAQSPAPSVSKAAKGIPR